MNYLIYNNNYLLHSFFRIQVLHTYVRGKYVLRSVHCLSFYTICLSIDVVSFLSPYVNHFNTGYNIVTAVNISY